MLRTKVKGTRFKAASNPENEPDFYSMPPVVVNKSDCNTIVPKTYSSQQQQVPSSVEPIPLQYADFVQKQVPSMSQYYRPAAQVPYLIAETVSPNPPESPDADCVLDDAVDELFFNEGAEERDTLDDFCSDWDPTFDSSFELSLNSDLQLGFMLEKLLED